MPRRHLLRDLAVSDLPDDEVFISEFEHDEALRGKEAQVTHWKANHADMVERARLLIERTDMPLVRVKAYELVTRTCQENIELLEVVEDSDQLLRDLLDVGDVGFAFAERIKQHLKKREQKQ